MAKRKGIMTSERKSRIKEMLSSRNPIEKDSTPLMNAANKARGKKASKKSYGKY